METAPARPAVLGVNKQINLITESLLEPGRMSVTHAVRIAADLAKRARSFDARLLEILESEPRSVAETSRALQILTHISDGRRLVARLQRLAGSSDSAIRAQASLLVARGVHNRDWVSEHLQDAEPRVRANVLEGAWEWLMDKHLLLRAAEDGHHRVAVNAWLRLHRLRVPETATLIEEFANRSDPWFRVALAWALGVTLDPLVQPHLLRLRSDPDPRVRWKALESLRRIRVHLSDTDEAVHRIRQNRSFLNEGSPSPEPELVSS